MVKALGLFSGGLDSILACLVIRDQGIEVEGLTFETPFFLAKKAKTSAGTIGLPLRVLNITESYIPLLKNPPHGYGKNLNPCIDCHAFMLKCAGEYMRQSGADFIFTGEVLGERPKSQNRWALGVVAEDSGFADYVVRPLSAKLLPMTKPEREGMVDRERLLAISGRGRKEQMRLAGHYGITEYETPAGGCLLTYSGYCNKLRDVFDHYPDAELRHYELLALGRHFRLSPTSKLIVGKNKFENQIIESRALAHDCIVYPIDRMGPSGLILSQQGVLPDTGEQTLAARIVGRYCKPHKQQIDMVVRSPHYGIDTVIHIERMAPAEVTPYQI